jgi:cathepsin B
MKSFILIFNILLVFILAKEHLSGKHLRHQKKLVKKINNLHTTWKAELYPFDIKSNLGVLLDPETKSFKNPRLSIPARNVTPIEDLPENFDLREEYPYCNSLFEIRDQANCGSCWAVASVETMSDRHCIISKGAQKPILSASAVISCCSLCGKGCSGGLPYEAFIYWLGAGIPTGGEYGDKDTCMPYFLPKCNHHLNDTGLPDCPETAKEPSCNKTCQDGYDVEYLDDRYFATEYYTVKGEQQIMTEIYERGSIESNFLVYEDFVNYKEGVYQYVEGELLGGHAIKIIGWGVENGVKYWLCVNSWNEFWGDKGTFKILRGEDHCKIESNIVTGMPKLD